MVQRPFYDLRFTIRAEGWDIRRVVCYCAIVMLDTCVSVDTLVRFCIFFTFALSVLMDLSSTLA